jgi:hypothetical protein
MPYYSNVDIRFDNNFQVWKLNYAFTVRVNNLFGNRNVNDVYDETGLAYTSQNNNGQIITGIPFDEDPVNYEVSRQVLVGLSVNF